MSKSLAAGAAPALSATPAEARSRPQPGPVRNVVLVHGAFAETRARPPRLLPARRDDDA